MSRVTHPAPPESFRELVYKAGECWYFKDIPENHKRKFRDYAIGYSPANTTGCRPSIRIDGVKHLTSRVIYWLETGDWPEEVAHKDYDYRNLRISNLMPCTTQLTVLRRSTNYSVRKERKCNKYNARITIGKKTIHIGNYDTRELATIAAWRVREALYPGLCPIPREAMEIAMREQLKNLNDSGSSKTE